MKRKPLAKWLAWLTISCLPLFAACYGELKLPPEIGSFKVEFAKGTVLGTTQKPLKVQRVPFKYTLNITALKPDKSVDTSFNGSVCVYSNRGILIGSHKPIPLVKGVAQNKSLNLKLAFGRTTFWVSESGSAGKKVETCPNSANPQDTTAPHIGRVGSAPDLHFASLSIQDLQTSEVKPFDSPLFKKYALIKQGTMVVTGVTNNGFYVTDINALKAGAGYHSLFVFTFSAPSLTFSEEGRDPKTLQVGDIVTHVEGGVDEFSGMTQITFPNFVPKWKDEKKGIVAQATKEQFPKPIKFDIADTWSRGKMEQYESALVEVNNAIAVPFDQNQDGWKQFRQWPILLVRAVKKEDQNKCEELVKTELYLHADPKKNVNSTYRACLKTCHEDYSKKLAACGNKDDADTDAKKAAYQACAEKATSAWFSCFFSSCRFDRSKGLFARFQKAGCDYTLLLIISNSTIPGYDPTTKEHLTRRFPYVRGILVQSRASGFYKLSRTQYDNEQSNNGYVIWVRGPEDLGLPK